MNGPQWVGVNTNIVSAPVEGLRKRIKSIAGAPNYIFVSIMVSMPIARSCCLAGAGLRNELFWTEKINIESLPRFIFAVRP